jgi:hypothetical protein
MGGAQPDKEAPAGFEGGTVLDGCKYSDITQAREDGSSGLTHSDKAVFSDSGTFQSLAEMICERRDTEVGYVDVKLSEGGELLPASTAGRTTHSLRPPPLDFSPSALFEGRSLFASVLLATSIVPL